VPQVEVVERPILITEHRGQPGWCPRCRVTRYAPIPEPVRAAGLVGPHLTTLAGLAIDRVPATAAARALAKRFALHGDSVRARPITLVVGGCKRRRPANHMGSAGEARTAFFGVGSARRGRGRLAGATQQPAIWQPVQ
jgi:hypothetical protein